MLVKKAFRASLNSYKLIIIKILKTLQWEYENPIAKGSYEDRPIQVNSYRSKM